MSGVPSMFPIKKKWPILTGLVAALYYGANYYTISGFEHLRIEAVQRAGPTPAAQPGSMGAASTDVYGHGQVIHDPSRYAIRESDIPQPPGGWKLDRSERFNLFRQGLAEPSGPTRPVSRSTSGASPMATPDSFHSPGSLASIDGGFPSTSGTITPGAARPGPVNASPVLPLPSPPRDAPEPGSSQAFPSGNAQNRVRIASFHVEALGAAKLDKPHVMQLLVSIIKQYEVVALQGIRSSRDDILPMLTERLNQSGATYDYMIGPRVGRNGEHEQFAFLFDTSRIETDRYRLYTVDDPQDIIKFEPLVGWFRTKGIAADKAFTFSIVNLHLDGQRAAQERAILVDLIRAVETDGRQEDDWILLGNIQGSNQGLEALESTGVRFAVRDIPTLVDGSAMHDTIMFSPAATTEFTGRCGAMDFLRKRNLSIAEAQELSRHLPVWAEFSIDEGGMPGRVAPGRPFTAAPAISAASRVSGTNAPETHGFGNGKVPASNASSPAMVPVPPAEGIF